MNKKIALLIISSFSLITILSEIYFHLKSTLQTTGPLSTYSINRQLKVERPTFHNHLRYNSLQCRGPEFFIRDTPSVDILLLGDEQIENPQLTEEALISTLLEKLLNLSEGPLYRVLNAGLSPSGLARQNIFFQSLTSKIVPTLVIQFYFPNDLDDLIDSHLIDLNNNNSLETTPFRYSLVNFLRKSYLINKYFESSIKIKSENYGDINYPLLGTIEHDLHTPHLSPESEYALKLYKKSLKKTQELSLIWGSRLNSVFIPRPAMFESDLYKINRHLSRIKRIHSQLEIESIDLIPIFNEYFSKTSFQEARERIYFRHQPLLNRQGNLVVALTLADAILPNKYKNEIYIKKIKKFSDGFLEN